MIAPSSVYVAAFYAGVNTGVRTVPLNKRAGERLHVAATRSFVTAAK